MTQHSVQRRSRIFLKRYRSLSFAFARNMGKNISKNVSSKYSQKLLDYAEKATTDLL